MGRNVAVVTLVVGLKAQEVRRWTGGCGRPFPEPVYVGLIVGTGPDGAFANVGTLGDNFVVRDIATEFKVAVIDGAVGVVKGDDVLFDELGEGVAPQKRVDGIVVAGEEENASHSRSGGVASTDHSRHASRDEFGDPSGPRGHVLGMHSKIVQQKVHVLGETKARAVRLFVTERFL